MVLLKHINWRDFYVGVLTGIGFTKFWLISDGLLTRTALPYRKPPVAIWIISLVPLLTVFWSLDPVACVFWFWRVHVLYGSYNKVQSRKSLGLGVGIVVVVQLVLALFDDAVRPDALTDNAQRYAMLSWALIGTNPYLSVLGGANIGVAAARITVGLIIGVAIWTRKKSIIIAAVIAIVFTVFYTPDARYEIQHITHSIVIRMQLITGESITEIEPKDLSSSIVSSVVEDVQIASIIVDRPDLIGKAKQDEKGFYIREWVWYGYGYGSFND